MEGSERGVLADGYGKFRSLVWNLPATAGGAGVRMLLARRGDARMRLQINVGVGGHHEYMPRAGGS